MRRLTAIMLLPLFLFTTLMPRQVQEELTRLPVLFKHFQMHKEQLPPTSFLQYLQLHYGSGFTLHQPAHDHSQLPMKSGENHLHAPAPLVLAPMPAPLMPPLSVAAVPPVFADQTYHLLLLQDIWQPPKSC